MSEQLLIGVDVKGEGDLTKLGKSMEDVAGSTKKAADEISKIRKQIKEAKSEMLKYTEGSKEYNAALAKAGQLQFKLKDINDKTKLSVRDMGETAKNVGKTVAGLGGAFGVVQGSMALFGAENEATLKTLQNLTAGLSIFQGLTAFADSIESMKDLIGGLKASSQATSSIIETTGAVTELSKATDDAVHSTANLAKESAVVGSNLAGVGVQTDNTNKILNNLKNNTEQYNKILDNFNNKLNYVEKLYEKGKITLEEYQEKTDEILYRYEQQKEKLDKTINSTEELTDSTKELTDSTKNLDKTTQSAGSSLGKTLLTMGALTVVIGLVIWGITKLVEWMNKIPKDLEIKLGINEESLKETQKIRETIKEISHEQQMANIAREKGDIKTTNTIQNNISKILDTVKDGLGKEYLSYKDKDKWLNDFYNKELERQRKLAYNKVLFAKQADAEVIKSESEQALKFIDIEKGFRNKETGFLIKEKLQERTDYYKKLEETYQKGEEALGVTIATGIDKTALNAYTKLKKAKKDISILTGIKPEKVIQEVEQKTPTGGGGSTSTSVDISGGSNFEEKINDLEYYTKNFEFKYTQYLETYKGLTEEEKVINANLASNISRTSDLSVQTQLRQQKRVIDARMVDLNNQKDVIEKDLKFKETLRQNQIESSRNTINTLFDEIEEKKRLNNIVIESQNNLNKKIKKIDEEVKEKNKKLQEEATKYTKTHTDAEVEINNKRVNKLIESNNKLNDKNKEIRENATLLLTKTAKELSDLESAKTKAETDLNAAIASGADIDTLKNNLDQINNQIIDNSATASQLVRDSWIAAFDEIQMGLGKLGGTLSSLGNINDLMMTTIDNKTNHEKNSLELSDKYQKASTEEQEKMMYDLDKKNYDSKKKLFEQKKAYDIGVVTVETISGGIAAVTQGVKQFGPIAGAIIGGVEAGVLTASGLAAINEIRSRTLDAPIPPNSNNGGSSATSSMANIALNPSKTSLTSKEENLNMMSQSGKEVTNVVRVSDIDRVQKTVKTRENNSSY